MTDYEKQKDELKRFFNEFRTANQAGALLDYKYLNMKQKIADRLATEFIVDIDDLDEWEFTTENLVRDLLRNTKRYVSLVSEILDGDLPPPSVQFDRNNLTVLDVYIDQRNRLQQNAQQGTAGPQTITGSYPPELLRRFQVRFRNRDTAKGMSIRQVNAGEIGRLVNVRCIVTRASEVKPVVTVATYACDKCNSEIYQEVKGGQFMPQRVCESTICKGNKASGELALQTRGSKFDKFQELKVQEISDQVPVGHIPRTLSIHVRGELTRLVTPGDMVTVHGIYLPVPYTGFKAIRAGLLSDTYLEAMHIERHKKSHIEEAQSRKYEEMMEEYESNEKVNMYDRLSASLCPEIYGHDDIKRVMLLQLVGGTERRMGDGLFIRGDINVLLTGDPGVAKSQLLKFVVRIAPRGVYTTGKGSSGVGLTAAVTRDALTNEMVLEAGALVLADKGICCIDEFDKMDENDRTAIHEVMEQQTVSIAKAGITTTLNARTAILAAANPAMGRFNPKMSASQNINLPAALLSRFDVQFLILDHPDMESDRRIADHITFVHREGRYPELEQEVLDMGFVRHYISVAREHNPILPESLVDDIVGKYAAMRQSETLNTQTAMFTSARNLLAVLRLSTALARLRFSDLVSKEDVEEALRLIHSSKASFIADRTPKADKAANRMGSLYRVILNLRKTTTTTGGSGTRKGRGADKTTVSMATIRATAEREGFTADELATCLHQFEDLQIWHISAGEKTLVFV